MSDRRHLTAGQASRGDPGGDASPTPIPEHVAIIMDGNGRWAARRNLPRVAGHREGMEAVRRTIEAGVELGIKNLTFYAFSTENWKRPSSEVTFLMSLPAVYLKTELASMIRNNIRLHLLGDVGGLPGHTRRAIENGVVKTSHCTGCNVVFALNYGARAELVRAARQLCMQVEKGELAPESVTESLFASHLWLPGLPDPDLIIRTSGEQRLSNFLLWQGAYSELLFVESYWPDFNRDELEQALRWFAGRNRRYGGLKK